MCKMLPYELHKDNDFWFWFWGLFFFSEQNTVFIASAFELGGQR
jgi:hypothetical protein